MPSGLQNFFFRRLNPQGGDPAPPPEKSAGIPANSHAATHESTLTAALARLPLDERQSWINEVNLRRMQE